MSNHLKPICPLTIEAIRNWSFCGNAWSDGPAFESIEMFAKDTSHSIKDRAEALYIMGSEGMGLTLEEMNLKGRAGTDPSEDAAVIQEFMESYS